MKTKLILGIIAGCFSLTVYGQNVDMERMERDLEIAKNVMQTLLGDGSNYILWSRNIEASYLEDYGVIFTLPNDFIYSFKRAVAVGGNRRERGDVEVIDARENKEQLERIEKVREAVTTFLVDYADIIGQLGPSDKIMVNARSRNDIFISVISEGNTTLEMEESGNPNFSAEISKKDISDYKQGKITREEAVSRIEFVEAKPEEMEQDLELFASIIRKLYSSDMSKTFFMNREPNYERIKGFGVIYYMTTYSSYENDNLYRMPVLGRDDVSKTEREETIEQLYPEFEEELKSVLIEYGRTIKSLDEDEVVLLKVKSTKCDNCSIPKSMELSVKKSVLIQFDQRKISLEEAKRSVKVQKNFDS